MHYYTRTFCSIIALLLGLQLLSCKKFLDQKPDKKLAVPSTLADAQRLLDGNSTMNSFWPSLGELVSDNYYVPVTNYNAASLNSRAHYRWDAAAETTLGNWIYGVVFIANVALETADKVEVSKQGEALYKQVKGGALFFRAHALYQMTHLFTLPYNKATAATDPGMPLRLTSAIDEPSKRSSVQETWDRILTDLKEAAALLPIDAGYKTRPNKVAAFALLASCYLDLEDYGKASAYADSALQLYKPLMDYNTLSPTSSTPFALFNPEVVHHNTYSGDLAGANNAIVDSVLYASYAGNDLRKTLFYTLVAGQPRLKGNYAALTNGVAFNGITTGEIYLTRAEGQARTGDVTGAMNTLNSLLVKRWKTGTFVPYTAANADEALVKILAERRKELAFRGKRWMDLRRLNKDPKFAVTLRRNIGGTIYELPPNDKRYALLIPQQVIDRSTVQQNPR